MDVVLFAIVVLIGVVLLALIGGFIASRLTVSRNMARGRLALPPAGPLDVEEAALSITAPFQGSGLLRFGEEVVLFGNGSNRQALTIPRESIVASVVSKDVPSGRGMQTLRWPALVLQIDDPTLPQGLAFIVKDPTAWVQRLRG